jgi:hypothetical protein
LVLCKRPQVKSRIQSCPQDCLKTPRDIEFRERRHRWLDLLVHRHHGCVPREDACLALVEKGFLDRL